MDLFKDMFKTDYFKWESGGYFYYKISYSCILKNPLYSFKKFYLSIVISQLFIQFF